MKIALTGHDFFIRRNKGLIPALQQHAGDVTALPSRRIPSHRLLKLLSVGPLRAPVRRHLWQHDRSAKGFIALSRHTDRRLKAADADFVLHMFSLFAPCWEKKRRFGMYLDNTMAQSARDWPDWACPPGDLAGWLAAEGRTYRAAEVLFTMGSSTARALVEDYGVQPERVHVVGSGGDFLAPYEGEKAFGSGMILFQGSEWERKGGDIVLEAFRQVRASVTRAHLVIIGTRAPAPEEGVSVLGPVPLEEVRMLQLAADVVAAPARCDPFPAFVIEAMNMGTPCIVSKVTGLSDQVGEAGVVLDPADAPSLAAALIDLLGDRARLARMSEAGRAVVARDLNWDAVARKMAPLIRAS